MKKSGFVISLFLLFSFLFSEHVIAQEAIKVACVGNSITFGAGLKDRKKDAYPIVLGRILGEGWNVQNFAVSGRTLLRKGDHPYWIEKRFTAAKEFAPDIVIIKLGTNDSKPQNWKYKKEFKKDLTDLVNEFAALPSHPKIYLGYPAFVAKGFGGIRDSIVREEIIPIIQKVAKKKHLEIIDFYDLLKGHPEMFVDGVHPNEAGAALMAAHVSEILLKEKNKN